MKLKEIRACCRRESDYIITLFITNEISLLFTWIFTKTKITPNQVTFASLFFGILTGVAFATGYLTGASIFLFISHILDCTDGNLARAIQKFNPMGKWYDMVGDRICEAALFLGVGTYFLSKGQGQWCGIALIDVVLLLLYYYAVDTKLTLGLTQKIQKLGKMKFKGVHVKWGLLEPVYYGFIILAPNGFLHIQLILIFLLTVMGISFQIKKLISV